MAAAHAVLPFVGAPTLVKCNLSLSYIDEASVDLSTATWPSSHFLSSQTYPSFRIRELRHSNFSQVYQASGRVERLLGEGWNIKLTDVERREFDWLVPVKERHDP